MANIGTFTAQNDSFTGTVRTLTLNVKVKFIPNAKESENAPDYRIIAGNFEIGAAWKKISKAERPYLSATLDDPSFPATIYARLVEGEDGAHSLIWSRSKGDRSSPPAPRPCGGAFLLPTPQSASGLNDLRACS